MENRNEGSGGRQRCVYRELDESTSYDEILRPEDFIADCVGSDGTRSKEFEQCRHIGCNHCGFCSYPLISEIPYDKNRATPSRCEHNKLQTAVNVTPEQKDVKIIPEHNELQTADCATYCSSSSDSDETVENSRQQKQNSNAELRNKTAAGSEWQQTEVQVITRIVRWKNPNIGCSLPFPDSPFDRVQGQKTVFKDRQIRLGNESPQMQLNVSDSTNNCIKWKDSPVENPLSKRNALHQTETLHWISNEEPFKSSHSFVNNTGRSSKHFSHPDRDYGFNQFPQDTSCTKRAVSNFMSPNRFSISDFQMSKEHGRSSKIFDPNASTYTSNQENSRTSRKQRSYSRCQQRKGGAPPIRYDVLENVRSQVSSNAGITAKENGPSVGMKPGYYGFKNYDDCREGSQLSQQNSGHNNRQQQLDYQKYANLPTDSGFQCQTCAGRMTERNGSTRMESGDETSAPVVHRLAGRQTSNDRQKWQNERFPARKEDSSFFHQTNNSIKRSTGKRNASKKKSNVITNKTTTSAAGTAVGPIKDVSENLKKLLDLLERQPLTGKEDEHKTTSLQEQQHENLKKLLDLLERQSLTAKEDEYKTTSLQEQQHVRTEISVSEVQNDTMAKLYDFGWKLQDSIIPSHVVLQMFKVIYKEWLEARITTLQMLNTLNTKIRGGGNWKTSFNTFCDGMNKAAEWAVKILNITPYAHAAQVVQIFPPILEEIREMVNDSKENAKGDLPSLSKDHDIRVLQRDIHLTSELQAFGILCEKKFQDTVQQITKFRDTLIDMEGQIGTCIEDVGLMHFIFRVCDREAIARGFMKTLSEAYRKFRYFQRESTSLQQEFCSFIDSDPSVLETMRFMDDSSMHWFLNLQETGNDLHRCWTDINSVFHSETENSEEAFRRIANFIRILETQKNDIDKNVSGIFRNS